MFKNLIQYFKEVRVELKKVSWPTRKEVTGSTIVVIVGTVLAAAFLAVCDLVWSTGLNLILRLRG